MADYIRDNGALLQHYEIPETGSRIRFSARDLRRQPTGVHGTVAILHGEIVLAWSRLNVERDEDRTRLSNTAHGHLPKLDQQVWPKAYAKHALDLFCAGLWREQVTSLAGELMEGDPDMGPPRQLLGPYLVGGGGTILYAPPGRGKSYVALAMAVSLDAGCQKVWPVPEARRALFVNLERARDSLRHRLARVNMALGLEPRRPLLFVNARGRSLADVADAVAETVRTHRVGALFLDSISRTSMGGKLLEDDVANRIIDALNSLCGTWLALGHTPRSDESHVFGSVHFEAGEDIGVRLVTQTGAGVTGIGLEVTKANDVPRPPMAVYALTWEKEGLTDIRPARRAEFPEIVGLEKPSLGELAREYLLLVGRADAATIAEEIGSDRTAVSRALSRDSRFGKTKDPSHGQRVLFYVAADGAYV